MNSRREVGYKTYIFDKQREGLRNAWFYKDSKHIRIGDRTDTKPGSMRRSQNFNPTCCYTCGQKIQWGDKVITKEGRGLSHIYHWSCAKSKLII